MDREQTNNGQIPRPSLIQFLGEPVRVWKDLWRSLLFQKTHQLPVQGDGHPVLVLPGFLGSDLSTTYLRRFISNLGYTVYAWEMGTNLGDIRQLHAILERIEKIYDKHQAKVSIIGWSLGGVYARQLAKKKPHLINQIITMGAPFADIEQSNNAAWLYKLINQRRPLTDEDREWIVDLPAPAPVPTTAIYSKEDGIVPWQTCMEPMEDEWHQNIEVEGSHFGMPYIPAVWVVIQDRLRWTQEEWKPFRQEEHLRSSKLVHFPSL